MNDTLKSIRERYSCRDFTNKLPSKEELNAIVTAGLQSPSGMNRQWWHLIVVSDKKLIDEMEQEGQEVLKNGNPQFYNHIMKTYGSIFYNAPCIILLALKGGDAGDSFIDLGIVAQNVSLAATSLGLANLHCGFVTLPFGGKRAEEFNKRLQVPNGYKCSMGILVGHAKTTASPHEPDFSKVTYIN